MSFTSTPLGGFIDGMRMHDSDQRIESRDERRADRHKWAGETHGQNQQMRALDLERMRRANQDEAASRKILEEDFGFKPGEVGALGKAFRGNVLRDDQDARQKEKAAGASRSGLQAKKNISQQEVLEHESDLRNMVRGITKFKMTGDADELARAMNDTHLGSGGEYSASFDGRGKLVITEGGEPILNIDEKDPQSMLKAFEGKISYMADPPAYWRARNAAKAKAQLEDKKHHNKLEEIYLKESLKKKGKDEGKVYFSIDGEKVERSQVRQRFNDMVKMLKESGEKPGVLEMFATMPSNPSPEEEATFKKRLRHVLTSKEGQTKLEHIQTLATDPTNPAAPFAGRALQLAEILYGVKLLKRTSSPVPKNNDLDPDDWKNY